MRISLRIIATCVAVIAGALATASPAAATRSQRDAEAAGTARARVTDIREILNQTGNNVTIYKGEDGTRISIGPNSRWAGSMWVSWVGNQGEIGKSIVISWGGSDHYRVFQDYWNSADQVRYSTYNSYQQSNPVAGDSTGGGRKRLTIRGDGSLFMERTA